MIYALPNEQILFTIPVKPDTSIEEAIVISKILDKYPQLKLEDLKVGVFSQVAKLSDKLRHMDRIEIYLPLLADPKELRKRKAARQKKENK